jgi:Nitronate monooxygenase
VAALVCSSPSLPAPPANQVTIDGSDSCSGAILAGMLRTAFTDLVGCQVPIQLAPMGGGVVTPELAMAVSRAGGLGMLQRAARFSWPTASPS